MWQDLQFPNWYDRGQSDNKNGESDADTFERIMKESGASINGKPS
jgi:hypothetical protein